MRWPWERKDQELDAELSFHLDELAAAYRRQGLSEKEARQRARADFGGAASVREECRDLRWGSWLGHAMRDIQFGLRMMRKAPGITGAALLSLALGIGATTAILSLAEAVLLRSLAIPDPQHLHEVLWEARGGVEMVRGSSGSSFEIDSVQVADFFSMAALRAMQEKAKGKAEIAAHWWPSTVSVTLPGATVVTTLRPVTGNFFETLRLEAARGRVLSASDDQENATPVAVLAHSFWQRHFGGREDVIGTKVRINNVVYEVSGVLPSSFYGITPGDDTEIYVPIVQSPRWLGPDRWYRDHSADPMAWMNQLIARRLPGTGVGELQSLLDAAFAATWAVAPTTPESTPHVRVSEAVHGLGSMRRRMGNPILMLCALVGLVLAVACANIANMLLARSVSREKEFALRATLGSGKGRLLRQLFTESMLLALLGGLASLPVTWMLTRLMLNFLPDGFERMLSESADLRLLAATGAVTILTAIVFGLYPAWRGARVRLAPALQEGAGSAGTMSRWMWAPAKALVLLQMAMGVLLMSAAIFFTSHLWQVLHQDTGFSSTNLLLFDLRPGEAGYPGDRLKSFYLSLEERLASVPGVESVGISRVRPMRSGGFWEATTLPGQTTKGVFTAIHCGSAGFLKTMRIPLLHGRGFTELEVRSNAPVAIISAKLAREMNLAQPVGSRLVWAKKEYEVIGVAGDARYGGMTSDPPVAYLPADLSLDAQTFVLRTSAPPASLAPALRAAVAELDETLPLVDIYTMEQQISRALQRERMFAWLCGSFGVLALILCVVGLYGLFSYTTARRVPEIGVRMAIGASRREVISQVLGEGLRLALAGLALGIPLAAWCGWVAHANELIPSSAGVYWAVAGALCVLAMAAVTAVIVPAIRASLVDPIQALRNG
jgi:predicted permease